MIGFPAENVPRELPEPSCGSCVHYDGNRCMKCWSDLDEEYYIPDRDDKNEDECCDDYEWDEEI